MRWSKKQTAKGRFMQTRINVYGDEVTTNIGVAAGLLSAGAISHNLLL
jgi:hypothetical protein